MTERRLRPWWYYIAWYAGLVAAMLAVGYVTR